MSRFCIIGVDPGRRGALACLFFTNSLELQYVKLEHVTRDPKEFFSFIKATIEGWVKDCPCVAVALEMPFAMKGQASMLSYGRYFGHLEMTLALACSASTHLYYPSQWQPNLMPRFKGYKSKELASYIFKKLFRLPEHLSEHDGVVDATCIALSYAVEMGILEKNLVNWKQFCLEKGISNVPRTWKMATNTKSQWALP